MEYENRLENEVKSWLKIILKNDKLRNLCVNIAGNTVKGDGYTGDVLFVDTYATTENGDTRKYNFVLKCSKKSEALRTSFPIKQMYLNEIHIYQKIFPIFNQFQLEKGIDDKFDSMPKSYGKLLKNNMEIVVLENLKKNGYVLWDKKKPMSRKHIEKVVEEYGKWHAISVAMKAQQPEKFQEVAAILEDTFDLLCNQSNMFPMFGKSVIEVYDLLKDDLDDDILTKWRGLEQQTPYIFNEMLKRGLKVIIHGDCWNNNFLFKHSGKDSEEPVKVAFLDWQMSGLKSPILDLSYFIFSCISGTDLDDLETILQCYYNSFSSFLISLGSDPQILYPFNQFLAEWKQFCKYGVIMGSIIVKICCSEKDEIFDLAEEVEGGKKICDMLDYVIKNKEPFKNRMKPIVKYVVEHEFV